MRRAVGRAALTVTPAASSHHRALPRLRAINKGHAELTARRGDVYCVFDRDIPGWTRTGKCRPCVVLARSGTGHVRVVPRTTRPRDPLLAIASSLAPPVFDKAG